MSFNADIIPFAKTMGVEIIEASPARVRGRLLVRPELCTAGGTLHGGAAMALAGRLGAVGVQTQLVLGGLGQSAAAAAARLAPVLSG